MVYIYSHGGYAREFSRLIALTQSESEIVFVDDAGGEGVLTYPEARLHRNTREAGMVIGFASAALRRKKAEIVKNDGFRVKSVCAPTAIIGDNVEIGPGAILSDYTILTADAVIGEGFHCNIFSYIAHDCEIGNYVTLAPRVAVNGRVVIEDDVYIGTGATILPGKPGKPVHIGKGAIIGAHALVTRDVAPGETVVGSPAKPLHRRPIIQPMETNTVSFGVMAQQRQSRYHSASSGKAR